MQLVSLIDQMTIQAHPRSQPLDWGLEIGSVTSDSREAKPQSLFVSLSGTQTQGHQNKTYEYIEDAVARGAIAILADSTISDTVVESLATRGVPVLVAETPRQILAHLAAKFFPLQPQSVVAVTGTNGKSSVASFYRQLWSFAGERAANLGTLGLEAPDLEAIPHPSFPLTTPDPIALHKYLDLLAQHDIHKLSIEASSHGLDQHRLDGVRLSAAAFTNLTQDHLDYHGTMDAYFMAKVRLFSELLPSNGTAVLNRDCPEYAELEAACRKRGHKVISYGSKESDIWIQKIVSVPEGQHVTLSVHGLSYAFMIPLFGTFQVFNLAAALGLFEATGGRLDRILHDELPLVAVVGRLQRVGTTPSGALVFVDYAHTPDALRAVLISLRLATNKRILVVFGCGGDRDTSKRALMGQVASHYADGLIITDDNPRSESPEKIRQQILEGCQDCEGAVLEENGDRRVAIEHALKLAEEGDIVLVAGKGHEKGQIIGHEILPFDDTEVVRLCIRDLAELAYARRRTKHPQK